MDTYLFDLRIYGDTAIVKRSRSICVLWSEMRVIYKLIKPLKNTSKLFFSTYTIKNRLDLPKEVLYATVGQWLAMQECRHSKFAPSGNRTQVARRAEIQYINSQKIQPWTQKVQNIFDCQLLKVHNFATIDIKRDFLLPHFKDPIHIHLESEE